MAVRNSSKRRGRAGCKEKCGKKQSEKGLGERKGEGC